MNFQTLEPLQARPRRDPIGPLPNEELAELREISALLQTQDNACTSDPLYCVRQRRKILGVSLEFCDARQRVWVDAEGCEAGPSKAAELERAKSCGEDLGDWTQYGFVEVEETVTACFTRRAAERFLQANRHNLKNPYIYVESLYRNREMKRIREFLKTGEFLLPRMDPARHVDSDALFRWLDDPNSPSALEAFEVGATRNLALRIQALRQKAQ